MGEQRSQRRSIALGKALRQAGPLHAKERERAAGSWVVQVARYEMGVQVGEGVAQHLVVHLQRPVVALEGLRNPENFQPILGRLGRLKLGRLRHVPSPPDHEGVPPLHVGPLEVGVTVSGRLDADAEPVVIGPALRTHRAASARQHGVPGCWPCRGHALSPLAGGATESGGTPGPPDQEYAQYGRWPGSDAARTWGYRHRVIAPDGEIPSTTGTHVNLAANELRPDERAVACLTVRMRSR